MKSKGSDFLIIAHRGFSAKYPENTLRAFEEAIRLKAPAIELDVHLCKDRKIVVTHDYVLGRCVKGSGTLADFTAQELSGMDAGSFKAPAFAQEGVSTIAKVLELVGGRSLVNIEIKYESLLAQQDYEEMLHGLLEVARPYGLERLLFSSFDSHALKRLRLLSSTARIALLDDCADRGPRIREAQDLGAEAYNINLHRASLGLVKLLQSHGLKVYTYTAKTIADLRFAQILGVDGVFADNLDEALDSAS